MFLIATHSVLSIINTNNVIDFNSSIFYKTNIKHLFKLVQFIIANISNSNLENTIK